jgi:hypothetical protein
MRAAGVSSSCSNLNFETLEWVEVDDCAIAAVEQRLDHGKAHIRPAVSSQTIEACPEELLRMTTSPRRTKIVNAMVVFIHSWRLETPRAVNAYHATTTVEIVQKSPGTPWSIQ